MIECFKIEKEVDPKEFTKWEILLESKMKKTKSWRPMYDMYSKVYVNEKVYCTDSISACFFKAPKDLKSGFYSVVKQSSKEIILEKVDDLRSGKFPLDSIDELCKNSLKYPAKIKIDFDVYDIKLFCSKIISIFGKNLVGLNYEIIYKIFKHSCIGMNTAEIIFQPEALHPVIITIHDLTCIVMPSDFFSEYSNEKFKIEKNITKRGKNK